ncbi:MAG: hypothetical protein C4519_00680 [Desulfobacteraceae bacterium]|nr:MAG: hypothetical protein C4519_00680 [Desulfobacteraceae bacterium]
MTTHSAIRRREMQDPHLNRWWVFRMGAAGGLAAGIGYMLFEMSAAWLLKGELFSPLRSIAAMLLGRDALAPWYSAFAAVLIGMAIHLMLSICFGWLFAFLAARYRIRSGSPLAWLGWGGMFGTGLWIVNFYLVAPLFGWYWFPLGTLPFVQAFLGHAFFFGALLGWLVHRRLKPYLPPGSTRDVPVHGGVPR